MKNLRPTRRTLLRIVPATLGEPSQAVVGALVAHHIEKSVS